MRPTRSSARVVALIAVATVAHAERLPSAPLATQTQTLSNGMSVVIAPDPAATAVVVHVRYAGGAADETTEQSGYTHLVEKLLFAGSVHVKAGDYDARIDAAGGFTGSVAGTDHLSVYEQVPAGALELALWLEAERMAGLADGITDTGIAAARDAIAAEFASAYVDQPFALVAREVQRALWPDAHPYGNDVLGDGATLARASRASVRAFVRERIRPRNATLVIAGNVDASAAATLAKRYFGWIPDRAGPARDTAVVAPLAAQRTTRVVDPVPEVVVAYRLPAPSDPDFLALEVTARLLAGSRAAALSHALVETDLATEVSASIVRHARGGELRITVTPKAWTNLPAIADTVLTTIAGLTRTAVAERDLQAAIAAFDTDTLVALEGLVYRAYALARWQAVEGAAYLAQLPDRLHRITPATLQRVAAKWLASTASVVVFGAPGAP